MGDFSKTANQGHHWSPAPPLCEPPCLTTTTPLTYLELCQVDLDETGSPRELQKRFPESSRELKTSTSELNFTSHFIDSKGLIGGGGGQEGWWEAGAE